MARLTVQFPERTTQILKEMAEDEESTQTETLKRALALYKYLRSEIKKEKGRKISITDKDDKIIKEIVMTE